MLWPPTLYGVGIYGGSLYPPGVGASAAVILPGVEAVAEAGIITQLVTQPVFVSLVGVEATAEAGTIIFAPPVTEQGTVSNALPDVDTSSALPD